MKCSLGISNFLEGISSLSHSVVFQQRHHFADKGPSSQSYDFSRSHAWLWELGYKEGWALTNGCFWTVVLEKTLESPLDCKEVQPVHPKGNQSWIFIHWKDWCWSWNSSALATCWEELTHLKIPWCWERLRAGGEGDDRGWVGWHHQHNGHVIGWTPGVGDGQGDLACCDSWGRKESDTSERLNWTENSITQKLWAIKPCLWPRIEFFSSGGIFRVSATTFHYFEEYCLEYSSDLVLHKNSYKSAF